MKLMRSRFIYFTREVHVVFLLGHAAVSLFRVTSVFASFSEACVHHVHWCRCGLKVLGHSTQHQMISAVYFTFER